MSFILDALRKSEHERQRNRAPGIADVRAPQKQSNRGIWIPLVALLAGLNLALLAVLWFAGSDKDTQQTAAQNIPNRPAQQQGSAMNSDARNLSTELEAPANIDEMQDPARFASIAPPVARTEPTVNNTATETISNRMLTVTEAMLDGSLSIAPLHLDIHVYSDDPGERFVFINTSRYGEGERISEGPTVSTINEQGVVLNYQGRDYLLARD